MNDKLKFLAAYTDTEYILVGSTATLIHLKKYGEILPMSDVDVVVRARDADIFKQRVREVLGEDAIDIDFPFEESDRNFDSIPSEVVDGLTIIAEYECFMHALDQYRFFNRYPASDDDEKAYTFSRKQAFASAIKRVGYTYDREIEPDIDEAVNEYYDNDNDNEFIEYMLTRFPALLVYNTMLFYRGRLVCKSSTLPLTQKRRSVNFINCICTIILIVYGLLITSILLLTQKLRSVDFIDYMCTIIISIVYITSIISILSMTQKCKLHQLYM